MGIWSIRIPQEFNGRLQNRLSRPTLGLLYSVPVTIMHGGSHNPLTRDRLITSAFFPMKGRGALYITLLTAVLLLLRYGCSVSSSSLSHCSETTFDYFPLPAFYASYYQNTRAVYIVCSPLTGNELAEKIDSFICTELLTTRFKPREPQFVVNFLFETEKTNVQNLTKNPQDFDKYAFPDNIIYSYMWQNGKFVRRMPGQKLEGETEVSAYPTQVIECTQAYLSSHSNDASTNLDPELD